MTEVKFIIPGEPKGKGRPRFSIRKSKSGVPYTNVRTPQETVIYENLIRIEYQRQCGDTFFDRDVPVRMGITVYHSIPKSTSKKRAKMMIEGAIRPTTKKGDMDNIIKAFMDACNRVAYCDDAQVVEVHGAKFYDDIPRVEVSISGITAEEE